MLNNTYTLGVTPDNLTYVKLYPDANKSRFSVTGLAPSLAKTLDISHQVSGRNQRSMASVDWNVADPASTTGGTAQARAYFVVQRPDFMSETEAKKLISHLETLIKDGTFLSAFLNREV
jgi:hypothetical protein